MSYSTHWGSLSRWCIDIGLLPLVAFALAACDKPTPNGAPPAEKKAATSQSMTTPQPAGLAKAPEADMELTKQYVNNDVHFDLDVPEADVIDENIPCDKPKDCGLTGRIHLAIRPERNANEVDWKEALTNQAYNGHIVAVVQNMSNRTFPPLDLHHLGLAYLYVGPTDPNNVNVRQVAYYKINRTTGEAVKLAVVGYNICNKAKHPNTAVHFRKKGDCAYMRPEAARADTGTVAKTGTRTPTVPQNGGLWVSCDNGCCQVGANKGWYTSLTAATPAAPR